MGLGANEPTNPRPSDALPDSRFSVILVEPQYPDNVGHTARTMLNFGVGALWLVHAAEVDGLARDRAVHAQGVLDAARRVDSLEEARAHHDVLVGFAARISRLDKAHLRMSEDLETVSGRLAGMEGRIGLVFGREDFGLSNEDVARCDILCTIPTAPTYRSMNLSHAVAVALYELTRGQAGQMPRIRVATAREKEILFATWWHLTAQLGLPAHRRREALRMFRRVVGRSGLSSWEYHRLMGVLTRSLRRMDAWPMPGVEAPPDDEV